MTSDSGLSPLRVEGVGEAECAFRPAEVVEREAEGTGGGSMGGEVDMDFTDCEIGDAGGFEGGFFCGPDSKSCVERVAVEMVFFRIHEAWGNAQQLWPGGFDVDSYGVAGIDGQQGSVGAVTY